jgi:hypothetical protein
MEGIQIFGPWRVTAARASRRRNEQRERQPQTRAASQHIAPLETRKRAEWAVADVTTLERAAEARSRCGSWSPGAAANYADWRALADAEDLLRGVDKSTADERIEARARGRNRAHAPVCVSSSDLAPPSS